MSTGNTEKFNEYIIQWIAVVVVGAIFSGIRDWVYGISSEKIGVSIRSRFFKAIIEKDIGFYDERKVGDIRK